MIDKPMTYGLIAEDGSTIDFDTPEELLRYKVRPFIERGEMTEEQADAIVAEGAAEMRAQVGDVPTKH
jgi:hypothetical protein